MKALTQKSVMTIALFSLSTLAMAHPGHALSSSTNIADAVVAGLMHPISGLDHVVLAVGMGMLFANHKKVGLGLLLSSLLVGFASVQLLDVSLSSSLIESAILASVILTAVAVLGERTQFAKNYQKGFSMLIAVGLFGLTLFHGMAHAVEMPIGSVTEGFAVGMMAAMSALFAVGASVMNWVKAKSARQPNHPWLAWLPSVMATLGMALVLAI